MGQHDPGAGVGAALSGHQVGRYAPPAAPTAANARGPSRVVRLAQVVGAAVMLLGVLTGVGASFGFALRGPRDATAAISSRVDSATSRIERLEATVTGQGEQLRALQEGQRLTNYIQCVQLRRSDPAAVPPSCETYTMGSRP